MTNASEGNWLARYRNEEGKQQYKALGDFSRFPDHERFDRAKAAAEEWFTHLGMGGSTESFTVKKVCERYVQHLRDEGREKAADDTDARFKRWVYSDAKFSGTDLGKLRESQVKDWRRALKRTAVRVGRGENASERERSDSALNRDMTSLRAAMNLALNDRLVTSSLAWDRALTPVKNVGKRRNDYLDRKQRRALLTKSLGALAVFLRGLCLVPIRPGALAALQVNDFDPKLRTLIIGKDKQGQDRRISLPESTAAFFVEQRKGKLPTAPLLADDRGGHWNKDSWKKPMKEAVRAAKLPITVTAYTLRHSVITDLIHAGLDALTVAQLSGTSIAMIEKHYGHLTAERSREALATLAI